MAFELATEDFISSMPDGVVTHILDRLPIQDAVKTSILSKNWRFKWTMLSQLVFDENFHKYLNKTQGKSKVGEIISRVLLNLKGSITKFVLYNSNKLDFDENELNHLILDDEDIVNWILLLSKKGLEDLTIERMSGKRLELPTHLFSCLELKHLKLFNYHFNPPASFHGFPKLLSLECGLLNSESSRFGEFIAQSPLLEILNLRYQHYLFELWNTCGLEGKIVKVKPVEIAKLSNLKILSLRCDTVMITKDHSIFELLGFLPKLQELNLDFVRCQFTKYDAEKQLPATFPCLKTLELSRIDVYDGVLLSCALELIRSCPNLKTLGILAAYSSDKDPTLAVDVDYNTTGLLQLQSVDVSLFKDSVIEVGLIKYLLASSPFLKRFVVDPHPRLSPVGKLMFARKLLKLHRASPVAEIDLY